MDDLTHAAAWGLVRSAQAEHPGRFVLVDVQGDIDFHGALARGVPAHGDSPKGNPATGVPAHGTPAHGTPAHDNLTHGTPAHDNLTHGTPAHDNLTHGTPATGTRPPVSPPPPPPTAGSPPSWRRCGPTSRSSLCAPGSCTRRGSRGWRPWTGRRCPVLTRRGPCWSLARPAPWAGRWPVTW
ncbi:hypothetical protein SVIO_043590 [Streptomyces violaceusniger]|uniref:Polyketide synthase extender module SpnB-like Rossmann fold domain-containing protein n=1 Tax=Streptomyces violaceusniger TaxID=68280 RepID=A0A4D4L3J5_STRVO|nr:hypothetical protein SVIO_043590 [Streptomyces violaceusniger]